MRNLQSELENWQEHQLEMLWEEFCIAERENDYDPRYSDEAFENFCERNTSWLR